MNAPLPKGSTIGVVGNGQLGRMFIQAAHQIGYQAWVFGPGSDSPAGQVADREFDADYSDTAALDEFAAGVKVVTFEFENIPRETLDHLAARVPTYPSPNVLHTTQHRYREKSWLKSNGFPLPEFVLVRSRWELDQAVEDIGRPCVLKTASFGYDGKGQSKIEVGTDLDAAWDALGGGEAVLEEWVSYDKELSVVCARNSQGHTRCFPVCHNTHSRHILAVTQAPANIPSEIMHKAQAYAVQVTQALKVVGLLTSELFLTAEGDILFNELAPRPHNSGHFSIDACDSSQFAHHVLAVTGRPLAPIVQKKPAMMVNLLGDLWQSGDPPLDQMAALPGAHLHLYGKKEMRARRKVGHLTVLGELPDPLRETLWRLGTDQVFEAPAELGFAERLQGRLNRVPFAPFDIVLAGGERWRVDAPDAVSQMRGRWFYAGADGVPREIPTAETQLSV